MSKVKNSLLFLTFASAILFGDSTMASQNQGSLAIGDGVEDIGDLPLPNQDGASREEILAAKKMGQLLGHRDTAYKQILKLLNKKNLTEQKREVDDAVKINFYLKRQMRLHTPETAVDGVINGAIKGLSSFTAQKTLSGLNWLWNNVWSYVPFVDRSEENLARAAQYAQCLKSASNRPTYGTTRTLFINTIAGVTNIRAPERTLTFQALCEFVRPLGDVSLSSWMDKKFCKLAGQDLPAEFKQHEAETLKQMQEQQKSTAPANNLVGQYLNLMKQEGAGAQQKDTTLKDAQEAQQQKIDEAPKKQEIVDDHDKNDAKENKS